VHKLYATLLCIGPYNCEQTEQNEPQPVAHEPPKRTFYQFLPESERLPVVGATSKQFRDRRLPLKIDSAPGGARARYDAASRRRVRHLPPSASRYKRPTNRAITTPGLGGGRSRGSTEIDLHRPKYRLAPLDCERDRAYRTLRNYRKLPTRSV